jgi:uncharacterized membrane protein YgcG
MKKLVFLFVLFLALVAFFQPLNFQKEKASAYSSPSLKCYSYDVEITLNPDRTLHVKERIDIEFLKSGFTMFYKSLPKDSKYSNIQASCEGNDEFTYYVDENPDYSEFIDICCVGNAGKGNRWTYDISYVMEPAGEDLENGMRLDVVGFGSPFELNEVSVTINFPEKPISCERYVQGVYGSEEKESVVNGWSDDGKTLVIYEKNLPLVYNDEYGERTAEGITLEFVFEKGVLDSFFATQIWTERTWIIFVFGLLAIGLAISGYYFGKKPGEIVSVVNIKAPDEMDPMKMGYLIDGSINDEDVTSMIYYFADKGYLTIDFTDEDDPVLNHKTEIPDDAPIYQKTLFKGLFKMGSSVPVSALKEKYYESVDAAKLQLAMKKIPRYDKKSVAGFLFSTVFSILAGVFAFVAAGLIYVGGDYAPFVGVSLAIVFAITALLLWAKKDLEFKKGRGAIFGVLIVVYAIGFSIVTFLVGKHVFTSYERFYLCALTLAAQLIGYCTLSRTETYNKTLGDILGFKDFIVVTEEEKIKIMLEENPELYYKVLPYAQVLGVTDEWTDKFQNILIKQPEWAVGFSMYDYLIINRSMRLASRSMTLRPQNSGSTVGRTGGGGFGGFSGGGRGGGGFGAR